MSAPTSAPRRAPLPQRLAMSLWVSLYRLSSGAIGGRMGSTRILLLTTTGRKSGKEHVVLLGYFKDGETPFVVASHGGSDNHPAWYLNLVAHPQVVAQIGGKRAPYTAEVASPDERARLWAQVIATAPSYAPLQQTTTREIPIVLLRPRA